VLIYSCVDTYVICIYLHCWIGALTKEYWCRQCGHVTYINYVAVEGLFIYVISLLLVLQCLAMQTAFGYPEADMDAHMLGSGAEEGSD
jgi:hypothetical protein